MAKKENLVSKTQFIDQKFQPPSFRPLTGNPAEKIQAFIAQSRTCADEELVVFYGVEASNREKTDAVRIRLGHVTVWERDAIDSKALEDNFRGRRGGIVFEYVLAVELGNRHTEAALA